MERAEGVEKTPTLLVVLAWVVVTIPLAWGVYTSVKKALPLFQAGAASRAGP